MIMPVSAQAHIRIPYAAIHTTRLRRGRQAASNDAVQSSWL
jgi:hypothetical protein